MQLNLHPKGSMLLLQAMEEAAVSKGGIIIPEAHRKQMNQGIIVELGPDASPANFAPGDIVIFPLHSEYRIDQDDTLYLLVESGQILASDDGEQRLSEGGVESLRLNKIKKVPTPPLQDQPTRRKPIGLSNVVQQSVRVETLRVC